MGDGEHNYPIAGYLESFKYKPAEPLTKNPLKIDDVKLTIGAPRYKNDISQCPLKVSDVEVPTVLINIWISQDFTSDFSCLHKYDDLSSTAMYKCVQSLERFPLWILKGGGDEYVNFELIVLVYKSLITGRSFNDLQFMLAIISGHKVIVSAVGVVTVQPCLAFFRT